MMKADSDKGILTTEEQEDLDKRIASHKKGESSWSQATAPNRKAGMKYTLLVKVEALLDLTDAYEWHEQKRTGLGIEFLDEVGECYDHISRNREQ